MQLRLMARRGREGHGRTVLRCTIYSILLYTDVVERESSDRKSPYALTSISLTFPDALAYATENSRFFLFHSHVKFPFLGSFCTTSSHSRHCVFYLRIQIAYVITHKERERKEGGIKVVKLNKIHKKKTL